MNPFTFLYNEILFKPILNLLVGITYILPTHSMGLAVILVTIIIRLILLPSSLHHAKQMYRNQSKMGEIKSKIAEINKKYKDDKTKKAEETMALYKKAGINPASGCLPLLIQLPIMIALYQVFLGGISPDVYPLLYNFVTPPPEVSLMFVGVNLQESNLILALLAGIGQFVQVKYFSPTPPAAAPGGDDKSAEMMAAMQKNMTYIFPVMTVFISLQFPAALALYWLTSTVFAIGQQYILKKKFHLEGNPPSV